MPDKLKEIKKFDGDWSLPNSKFIIPGSLTIDEENFNIQLSLFANNDLNGEKINNLRPTFTKIPLLNGITWNDNIALYGLSLLNLKRIGKDFYEILYKIDFLFIGCNFNSKDEILFSEIRCSYPYFVSWYDDYKDYFSPYLQSDGLFGGVKTELKNDELKDIIIVDQDFSIEITREYNFPYLVSERNINLSIKHYVTFKFVVPKPILEILNYANHFKQLLQFTTGRLLHIDFVSCLTNKDKVKTHPKAYYRIKKESVSLSISHFSNLEKRKLINTDFINQNNMLFCSSKNDKKELHDVVTNWYSTINKYIVIYNIFLDNDEWLQNTDAFLSQIMFNNRFLNLIQALEGFHQFSHPDKFELAKVESDNKLKRILDKFNFENAKDRKWIEKRIKPLFNLEQKLDDIFKENNLIIKLLFFSDKEKSDFKKHINIIRNGFSHGNPIKPEFESNWRIYYFKLLLILVSCILQNLNFNQVQIEKMILRCINYSEKIEYINYHRKLANKL